MTPTSARMFESGAVGGAQVGCSRTHGYWIFERHGFKAPPGAAIGDVAEAFDRLERAHSKVAVAFDPLLRSGRFPSRKPTQETAEE